MFISINQLSTFNHKSSLVFLVFLDLLWSLEAVDFDFSFWLLFSPFFDLFESFPVAFLESLLVSLTLEPWKITSFCFTTQISYKIKLENKIVPQQQQFQTKTIQQPFHFRDLHNWELTPQQWTNAELQNSEKRTTVHFIWHTYISQAYLGSQMCDLKASNEANKSFIHNNYSSVTITQWHR